MVITFYDLCTVTNSYKNVTTMDYQMVLTSEKIQDKKKLTRLNVCGSMILAGIFPVFLFLITSSFLLYFSNRYLPSCIRHSLEVDIRSLVPKLLFFF